MCALDQLALAEWGERSDPLVEAHAILNGALEASDPAAVYGMFSGGHDSLVAVHVLSQHPRFTAAVHINTGIGIAETREFVRETCKSQGWLLIEKSPPAGSTYEELVARFGFPGPMGHSVMYRHLKERALRDLVRETPGRRAVALVGGVRRSESPRRASRPDVNRAGRTVWISPLINWQTADRDDYIDVHALPRNPVTALLHMSGECLCGAYAKPGERQEIEFWFPQMKGEFARLEAIATERGHRFCRWGHGQVGSTNPTAQTVLALGPMCWACDVQIEEESA